MMRCFVLALSFWLWSVPGWADPTLWHGEWPQTDFTTNSLENWDEIRSGGPPKDGIPALFDPQIIPAGDDRWLDPSDPVITVELPGGPARAYPLRYLTWHEIANDRIGDVPVAVTFCPLCNSAIVFDRRVNDEVLTFGVTGKLRHSDMVMYDHQSQSWWQQAEGIGIVGEMTGVTLTRIPVWTESWQAFVTRNPDGQVMAEPDWNRDYGRNPYVGYDTAARPFLYTGDMPPHGIDPLARVVAVAGQAWPLTRLAETPRIEEAGLILTWEGEQASALDTAQMSQGRPVAAIRVRNAAGQDVAHDVIFAFAFHAFWPTGDWFLGEAP